MFGLLTGLFGAWLAPAGGARGPRVFRAVPEVRTHTESYSEPRKTKTPVVNDYSSPVHVFLLGGEAGRCGNSVNGFHHLQIGHKRQIFAKQHF